MSKEDKSKILIVTALFPPEPVVSANLSFDLALELSKNYIVSVIAPFPSRPNGMCFYDFHESNYTFSLKRMNSYISNRSSIFSRFRESYSFGLQSLKFIKKNHKDIDLIYMNSWPLLAQLFVTITSKKYSLKLITHIQDIYPESLSQKLPILRSFINKILLPIDKYITQNSDSLITISNSMKDYLISTRKLSTEKVDVVFNWQDDSRYIIKTNDIVSGGDIFTFMYLGSISVLANIESLIFAFHNSSFANKCRLVIAGEGPEKKNLMNYVKKNNIQNVIFLSFESTEVGVIQAKSDVLILSLKKGASSYAFPSKLPAYMFSARPVLAYVDSSSEIADTIQNSNCGWVVESGNIESLIECFKHIVSLNKSDLIIKGENGKDYALIHLSRSSNLNKIVSIIEKHLD